MGTAVLLDGAVPTIRVTQHRIADDLVGRDPLALLVGVLLDQHVSRECGEMRAVTTA